MKIIFLTLCLSISFLPLIQANPKNDRDSGAKFAVIEKEKRPDSPTEPKFNTQPWVPARYENIKKKMQEQPCDILMVGDSITEQWENVGKKVWDELLLPKNAINFGISGDRTESVLWRMEDTKLKTTTIPKVCTLLIGTNNIGFWKEKQSADDTVKGVEKIARTLLAKFPKMHLIIFPTFPYGADPNASVRKLGDQITQKTAKLKLPRTTILNINKHFLNPDGTFKPGVFQDEVHLTEEGYRIWAEQMMPLINKFLPDKKTISPKP